MPRRVGQRALSSRDTVSEYKRAVEYIHANEATDTTMNCD